MTSNKTATKTATFFYKTFEGWYVGGGPFWAYPEITAPADSTHVIVIKPLEGDVIVRPYKNLKAARNAIRYYLDKFDAAEIGASGTWHELYSPELYV